MRLGDLTSEEVLEFCLKAERMIENGRREHPEGIFVVNPIDGTKFNVIDENSAATIAELKAVALSRLN